MPGISQDGPQWVPQLHMQSVEVPTDWPPEVDFILSALDAAARGRGRGERRGINRRTWRTVTALRLFSDDPSSMPWILYVRDVSLRDMGFITRDRLPLGFGGMLHVVDPDGGKLALACTVYRCRPTVEAWYEGALHFNREAHALFEAASALHP